MGDLKIENARLQKLADILDSQPELTFCIDITGNIHFISEKALNCMKSTVPEDSDDEPSHINQILTMESVQTVLESVAEVRNQFNYQDYLDGCTSSVQVCLLKCHSCVEKYAHSLADTCFFFLSVSIERLLSRRQWLPGSRIHPMFETDKASSF